MAMRQLMLASCFAAGVAGLVRARDSTPVFSGPQAGEELPPLMVQLVYGSVAGDKLDLVNLANGKPTLLVIVNGANRPAARLTRALMNHAEMRQDELFAGVVYLDGDLSAAEKYLRRSVSWWGVGPPVGVSLDGAEGPGSWGLNRNVNLTILIADKGRVAANFALIQPSLTDGPEILTEVNKLIDGRVPTNAEMAFLSIPTQKRGNASWQPAPDDIEMRRLICNALAADDERKAETAAAAVDAYVQDNASRQDVLGRAARGLLNRKGYTDVRGIPIVPHLRRWRAVWAAPDHPPRKRR